MTKPSSVTIALSAFSIPFLAGFWLVMMPRIEEVGRQRARLEAGLESQGGVAQAGSASEQATKERLRKDGEAVLALLPESDRQYDLAVQVEALAKDVGVSLTALSASGEKPVGPKTAAAEDGEAKKGAGATPAPSAPAQNGPSKVVLTLGITARSYEDVQRFVIGLTSLERFVSVDQLTVTGSAPAATAASPAPGAAGFSAQIVAFAYHLPKPASK